MSHNIIKVDSQEPSRQGSVDLSLQDLLDSVPADGHTPTYGGASWSNQAFTPETRTLYYSKYYYVANPGTTSRTYSNGDYFVWRTTLSVQPDEFVHSSVSLSAASSADSPLTSNGTWKQDITLSESGTYLWMIRPAFGSSFTSNDSCDVQLSDTSNSFSHRLHVSTEGKFGDAVYGIKTITSSTTFALIVDNISGTVDIMEQTAREFISINVWKLKV
jgi:hypothetical protein|tara:strand:+ start:388 stop:1038 length:651 start_codon:yes stop_codon:yes gene_type:complete